MIITIADAVFASLQQAFDPQAHAQMLSLLQFGVEGRHGILIDPLYDPKANRHVNQWLSRRDPETRESFEFALVSSPHAAVNGAFAVEIRVELIPAPIWDMEDKPPVMPLGVALELARRPLVILLEDFQNDREFLHRMAPSDYKASFDKALHNRWLIVDNGGGIDSMTRRIKALKGTPGEHLRLWVMFDSDRQTPDASSPQSAKLKNQCKAQKVAHHQLRRRAIENYLPREALDKYTLGQGALKRGTFKAYFEMKPSQRHCYHLKGGFKKDRGDTNKPLPEHFENHRDEPALQEGFGANVWDAACKFLPPPPPDSWCQDDGSLAEARDILLSILRRL